MTDKPRVSVGNIVAHKPEKGRDKYIIYFGIRMFLAFKNPTTGKWNLSLKASNFMQTYDQVSEGVSSLDKIFDIIEKEFNNGITSGVRDCRRNNDTGRSKTT